MCSLTSEHKYSISLPSSGRASLLVNCLKAIEKQTSRPEMLLIVNNNHDRTPINLPSHLNLNIKVLENDYFTLGPSQGHQTCLNWFLQNDFDYIIRWDDDLIPREDCMEKLMDKLITDNMFAIGGCYPKENNSIWNDGPLSGTRPPDGQESHIQFFEWKNTESVNVRSLYSGYAFLAKEAEKVGGFCVQYSPVDQRGETDLSLRLGKCAIEPKAVAVHLVSTGGTRQFQGQLLYEMAVHDHLLFKKRMKKLNINCDRYWEITA